MAKPTIFLRAKVGEREIEANGREAQALLALIAAGNAGITSLDTFRAGWAVRLAAYVNDLRRMGINIRTDREPHEGGHHGRYVLAAPVEIVWRSDVAKKEAA